MSSGLQYTRERLEEAAAECSDIDEVIGFLGTRPYANLRRYLMKRFTDFGIDVSHFSPCGRRPQPTHDDLRGVIAESASLTEALQRLDRPDNHWQRALLRQWIAEEGISTAHFLGQGHRRGKRSHNARGPEDILVRHEGKRRTGIALLRRALRDIGVPERCAGCGVGPEWLGKPMTLEVDHIDGEWSDDRRENLRLLCPNCHAITNTWCRGGRRRRVTPGTMADG
ncbi:HNH endonuclease [Streptomyces sp. NPDC001312]|uniref:HNH endonuclease signature motif containing protein n=1 Tax=Streptomyces sp. NPDC001312 TaxID=3364561 RepID=UPI0036C43296